MSEQDAAIEAEPTAAESAPAEQTTNDPESVEEIPAESPVEEPASAETESQDDSKSVPYDRFREVNESKKALEERNRQLEAHLAQQNPLTPPPELDAEAAAAVQTLAQGVYERQENTRFESKHAKTFAQDKLLRAAYMTEVQEDMQKGVYVDREEALTRAKAGLEARGIKLADKAKEEGIKEGQDIAKTKQKLGAVGEAGKVPDVSDDQLSAAELAKKYNIPTAN